MDKKLQDSELKVMNVIWREGETTAKHIADVLGDEVGWNVNTTYTLIKRCIEKGAVERSEPNFLCRALVKKEDVQRAETDALIGKLFDGSADKLFAALLGSRQLSAGELEKLRDMIDRLE
ncbi:MAG: BlaI/MecI/CopY family transcriptional regulator [Oscillospiraceae bacterium]|nr:BlaI/MecI/CopY family transcriptional regulator [Oscillospiraceae bacterium]